MTTLQRSRVLRGEGRRHVRRLVPAAAAACLAGAILTLSGAHELGPATALVLSREAAQIDQPETQLSAARLARAAVSWNGGPTSASTGETVTVYVSSSLPAEAGTPQTWANFISGLDHGAELSAVSAYIATFAEMQDVCGTQALGCYGGNRLVAIGELAGGVSPMDVVRHEYGHHIAYHRLNPPWTTIDWGPKSWASIENVCRRTGDGSAFPGDESDHYHLNPGEAWAETYRILEERKAGITTSLWNIVDGSFYPTDAVLQVAEHDVLNPWTAPRRLVAKRRFTPKSRRVWTIPIATSLDGTLDITVSLPKNSLYDVSLLDADGKTVIATVLWSSRTSKTVSAKICGERTLFVRLTQRAAFGRVVVSASVP